MSTKWPLVWCCSHLADAIQSQGNRGFSIELGFDAKLGVGLYFVLKFRAIALEDDIGRKPLDTPFPVTIRSQQAIRYCPWCGTLLRDYYYRFVDRLPISEDPWN